MTVLVDRNSVDQPYVQAIRVPAGPDKGKDRVYVGLNDFAAPGGKTATVDRSLDAATVPAPAGFQTFRIEARATSGQDGPPIRPGLGSIRARPVEFHPASSSRCPATFVDRRRLRCRRQPQSRFKFQIPIRISAAACLRSNRQI